MQVHWGDIKQGFLVPGGRRATLADFAGSDMCVYLVATINLGKEYL